MNKKDLRHLSRRDLLEMLLDLTKENERLKKANKQLEDALQDRTIAILEAGSLAEAALRLNGVFQAAQDACDQYVLNTQQRCKKLEDETKKRCDQMLADAKQVKQYEEEIPE
ncbi:MAG: DNA repair protein [Clostridia bacterium]|nr:DNA repair protein [Clostridia bacterium]